MARRSRPRDPSRDATRGSPRAALDLVRLHLERGTLSQKEVDEALCQTWVRFERVRDDVMGPTFGPFRWVQLTYQTLHVDFGPDGEENASLAYWDHVANEWFLEEAAGEHEGEFYSDVVVFRGRSDDDPAPGDHDCHAARHTVDPEAFGYEVRWDEEARHWARTGRRWISGEGRWAEANPPRAPWPRRRRR